MSEHRTSSAAVEAAGREDFVGARMGVMVVFVFFNEAFLFAWSARYRGLRAAPVSGARDLRLVVFRGWTRLLRPLLTVGGVFSASKVRDICWRRTGMVEGKGFEGQSCSGGEGGEGGIGVRIMDGNRAYICEAKNLWIGNPIEMRF